MTKIAIWTNRERTFRLSKPHIQWLQNHNAAVPQVCGEYNNFDPILIESIEAMRDIAVQNLKSEYNLYAQLQEKRVHFSQIANSFEAYVARFWTQLLEANLHMIGSPKLETLYNSIMYRYSWDEFQIACTELQLTLPDDADKKYSALINRRVVVSELRQKQDFAHDEYVKFCSIYVSSIIRTQSLL